MVKDQHPQAAKEASLTVLPVWLEAFKYLLQPDIAQELLGSRNWDGLGIRIQIFKVCGVHFLGSTPHTQRLQTLYNIHTSFPKALVPFLNDYLNLSLAHLVSLYPVFTHFYIQSSNSVPENSEDEVVELPQLLCPILDFLSATTRSSKAREWWFESNNLVNVIPAVFNYLQITDDDVSELDVVRT